MTDRSMKMNVRPDEPVTEPLTIGAVAMRPAITCPSDATVTGAARLMAEKRIGALVLEGDEPGIITERDIVFAVANGAAEAPVTSYASEHPVVVDSAESLDEAARRMATEGVRHLLVEEGGEVVGIFSARDLIANQVVRSEGG